jgi:hypothetical protein
LMLQASLQFETQSGRIPAQCAIASSNLRSRFLDGGLVNTEVHPFCTEADDLLLVVFLCLTPLMRIAFAGSRPRTPSHVRRRAGPVQVPRSYVLIGLGMVVLAPQFAVHEKLAQFEAQSFKTPMRAFATASSSRRSSSSTERSLKSKFINSRLKLAISWLRGFFTINSPFWLLIALRFR